MYIVLHSVMSCWSREMKVTAMFRHIQLSMLAGVDARQKGEFSKTPWVPMQSRTPEQEEIDHTPYTNVVESMPLNRI